MPHELFDHAFAPLCHLIHTAIKVLLTKQIELLERWE